MIYSDSAILEELEKGGLQISPFDENKLGSNSYDLKLHNVLTVYRDVVKVDSRGHCSIIPQHPTNGAIPFLDVKEKPETIDIIIPEEGLILYPNVLYLGSTTEFTESKNCVPFIDGKSSVGRFGIRIHATAGRGDEGFKGHWTLEIDVIHPVRVYPNMKIAQIYYFELKGKVKKSYANKKDAKYQNQGIKPVASEYYKNFSDSAEPKGKSSTDFEVQETLNC